MYQVDTNGVVYGKNHKPLKYSINHHGYCIVNFYHDHVRKGFAIHTLVALTFLTNYDENKTQVNHINGIKTDNNIENLEWVTAKENTKHSIEILGNSKQGKNNPNAKSIQGYDKYTHNLVYEFDTITDAAKYFNKDNYDGIKQVIISVLKGRKNLIKVASGYINNHLPE